MAPEPHGDMAHGDNGGHAQGACCPARPLTRWRIAAAGVSGAALIAAAFVQEHSFRAAIRDLLVHSHDGHPATSWPALTLFLIAIGSGAFQAVPGAITSVRRLRLDMTALVCIAILGAGGLGEWMEAGAVAFLYSVAGLLESWSHARRPHDHSQPALLPRFVAYYTPVMILISALTVLFTHSFYRALIVLMGSCPCALLIAAPVPLAAATLRGGSGAGLEDLTRRMHRAIHQNVAVTIAVKVLFLIPTLLGMTTLWMALATDQGVVLFVTLNGLRLLAANRKARFAR
jgi:cation transport ATPase